MMAGPKGCRPDAAKYLPAKGPGRPKGGHDKLSRLIKDNIIAVFDKIGGTGAMATWARKNRTEFYKLYARLVPTQVIATVDLRDASELSDDDLLQIIGTAGRGRADGEAPSGEVSGSVH